MQERVAHAERVEHAFAEDLGERAVGDAFGDAREQRVVRVRVPPPASRCEIELRRREHRGDLRVEIEIVEREPRASGRCGPRRVFRQAAREVDEVRERECFAEVLRLRDPARERIVEREFAVALEQRDRRRGELLRERRDVEHAVRVEWSRVLEAAVAACFERFDRAVAERGKDVSGRCVAGLCGLRGVSRATGRRDRSGGAGRKASEQRPSIDRDRHGAS